MRDIDIKTLRLFGAVCDSANMARAVEREPIEPSAISRRIAQLESDLGTPLLLRSRCSRSAGSPTTRRRALPASRAACG